MFLNHFSLNDHPFIEHPPIKWIMRDPRIDQALAVELGRLGLPKVLRHQVFIDHRQRWPGRTQGDRQVRFRHAEVGLDLSDLHPVILKNLSVGFEIERYRERDEGALAIFSH